MRRLSTAILQNSLAPRIIPAQLSSSQIRDITSNDSANQYLNTLAGSYPDKSDPSMLLNRDPLAIVKLIALCRQQRQQQSNISSTDVNLALIRGSSSEWPQYSLYAARDFLRECDIGRLNNNDAIMDRIISSSIQVFI